MISDTTYASSWDGVTTVAPSQNATYDAIQLHRDIGIMNGRLTVTSGSPIVSTSTTSSTLYYTPFGGNQVYLYTGTIWNRYTLTERSLALSGLTTNLPYDVFLYDNSGTLTLETTAWTDNVTRATALVFQDGILVRSGATTRRYVGTIYPISATQVTQGPATVATNTGFINSVYNYYNKVHGVYQNSNGVTFTAASSTTPWYTNAAIGVINGYDDDFTWTTEMMMVITNSTGSTHLAEIRYFDNIATATLAQEGQTMPTATSSEFSLTSVANTARQFGRATCQPTYFVANTGLTVNSAIFRVNFCF
jgi:hypothetical protein